MCGTLLRKIWVFYNYFNYEKCVYACVKTAGPTERLSCTINFFSFAVSTHIDFELAAITGNV